MISFSTQIETKFAIKEFLLALLAAVTVTFAASRANASCSETRCEDGSYPVISCNGESFSISVACSLVGANLNCEAKRGGQVVHTQTLAAPSAEEVSGRQSAQQEARRSRDNTTRDNTPMLFGSSSSLVRRQLMLTRFMAFKAAAFQAAASKACQRDESCAWFFRHEGALDPRTYIAPAIASSGRIGTEDLPGILQRTMKGLQVTEKEARTMVNFDSSGEGREQVSFVTRKDGSETRRNFVITRTRSGERVDVKLQDSLNDRETEFRFVGSKCFVWSDTRFPDSGVSRCEAEPNNLGCTRDGGWAAYRSATEGTGGAETATAAANRSQ